MNEGLTRERAMLELLEECIAFIPRLRAWFASGVAEPPADLYADGQRLREVIDGILFDGQPEYIQATRQYMDDLSKVLFREVNPTLWDVQAQVLDALETIIEYGADDPTERDGPTRVSLVFMRRAVGLIFGLTPPRRVVFDRILTELEEERDHYAELVRPETPEPFWRWARAHKRFRRPSTTGKEGHDGGL